MCVHARELQHSIAGSPFYFSIFYGRSELLGDKGREVSRLVDAEKRDQEGNKKLATRELLLGDGLSEERQARELVSGTHTHRAPAAKMRKADCLEILLVTARPTPKNPKPQILLHAFSYLALPNHASYPTQLSYPC